MHENTGDGAATFGDAPAVAGPVAMDVLHHIHHAALSVADDQRILVDDFRITQVDGAEGALADGHLALVDHDESIDVLIRERGYRPVPLGHVRTVAARGRDDVHHRRAGKGHVVGGVLGLPSFSAVGQAAEVDFEQVVTVGAVVIDGIEDELEAAQGAGLIRLEALQVHGTPGERQVLDDNGKVLVGSPVALGVVVEHAALQDIVLADAVLAVQVVLAEVQHVADGHGNRFHLAVRHLGDIESRHERAAYAVHGAQGDDGSAPLLRQVFPGIEDEVALQQAGDGLFNPVPFLIVGHRITDGGRVYVAGEGETVGTRREGDEHVAVLETEVAAVRPVLD